MRPVRIGPVVLTIVSLAVGACGDSTGPDLTGTPSTISISEARVLLESIGEQFQLDAILFGADGRSVPNPAVEWDTDNAAAVSITADGLATGVANGIAEIVAEVDGLRDSVLVTVFDGTGYFPIVGRSISCLDGLAAQFSCSNVELVSFLPLASVGATTGIAVNDLWGWTDPQNGNEYVLLAKEDGLAFVDVSDPVNPEYLGSLPSPTPPSSWRDVKVYQDHAFVVADGVVGHGIQVFDLAGLRNVTSIPTTFSETARYNEFGSAHNIVINEETGYAYVVGSSMGNSCGGGLHMVNIQTPASPTFAGCFADPLTGLAGTGYSHDAMCVVYQGPDTDYQGQEICFGSNETALSIADVTDKNNPIAVSNAAYPNVSYAHQGWITDDHRYFFTNDELDERSGLVDKTRTLIWDIEDLDDPVLASEYFGTTETIDHNLYVVGNRLYESNYLAGLRVLDISDVLSPVEIGYFDTTPLGENGTGFGGSWSNYPFFESGIIAVTSRSEGLFILRAN